MRASGHTRTGGGRKHFASSSGKSGGGSPLLPWKAVITAALLVCAAVFCLTPSALAAEAAVWTYAQTGAEDTRINAQTVGEETWLFLPSHMRPDSVALYFGGDTAVLEDAAGRTVTVQSGEAADLTVFSDGNGALAPVTVRSGGQETSVRILFSGGVDSLFLVSGDPSSHGRAWVEADKANRAQGGMALLDARGKAVWRGELTQIKGRGNSTWTAAKKPYQIKLKTSADLLETGREENSAKTWLLLANYYDASMLRNAAALGFAHTLGLSSTPEFTYTDLYYDGEYRGTYMLTEKVEVHEGRVPIHDLEKDIEAENPAYDFDAPLTAAGTTAWDTPCQYVEGISDPEDISGGYLLEMETGARIKEETSWFMTRYGDYLFVNSPEAVSRAALDYISSLYQHFEDAVYNGGVHPDTGKAYTDYMDLDSLAALYLVMESAGVNEGFYNSTFFYKKAGEDKLYTGPAWDFDLAYAKNETGLSVARSPLGRALMRLPDFAGRVAQMYRQRFYPAIKASIAEGGSLRAWESALLPSASMNYVLWPYASFSGAAQGGDGFEANTAYVLRYIRARGEWLYDSLAAGEEGYYDIHPDDWFYPYVIRLSEKGYVQGVAEGTFRPKEDITRADFVSILYRIAGEPAYPGDPFPDVRQTAYYGPAVSWAYAQGIVSGTSDGRFLPNSSISREQAVAILYRAAGEPDAAADLSAFRDAGEISSYARRAVEWAVSAGILSGSALRLHPLNAMTRAECAKVLDVYLTLA